jgi:hypothetical protein
MACGPPHYYSIAAPTASSITSRRSGMPQHFKPGLQLLDAGHTLATHHTGPACFLMPAGHDVASHGDGVVALAGQ